MSKKNTQLFLFQSLHSDNGKKRSDDQYIISDPHQDEELENFLQNSFLCKVSQGEFSIALTILKGLHSRDRYTFNHSVKVYLYTEILSKKMKLSEGEKEILLMASLLHDIGKIAIPDSILLKKETLTEEERSIIKQHPVYGAQFLKGVHLYGHKIAKTVLYHHEKWDGTGYPFGLSRNKIPLFSQIISICDVFDAITEWRPYRPPMKCDDALDYIVSQKEKHFHPEVVDLFLECYDDILAIKNLIIPKDYYMKRYEEQIDTVSKQLLLELIKKEE